MLIGKDNTKPPNSIESLALKCMKTETRLALLGESLGYWRKRGQNEHEGNGESARILIALAVAYGEGGKERFDVVAGVANINPRYYDAILETVREFAGSNN